MRKLTRSLPPPAIPAALAPALAVAGGLLLLCGAALSQVSGGTDRNVSKMANYQNECAIAKNPTNKLQLFASCNNSTGGLFAARSTDGGATWTYPDADKTIADGDAGQGPAACCDPALAWDTFGNLFITYLTNANTVETLLSTDAGLTFSNLVSLGSGNVDQPSVAAAAGAVWVVWNQSNQMRASGAAVTGLGVVGAFGAMQTIPGTTGCSFGDLAVSPGGAVVQACETPTGGQGPASILINIDADGLGAGNFGAASTATSTNVGGFDFIPAQNVRSIDAEAGLAFDADAGSPRFGRLYLVYTEEPVNENNDTDIMVRFSDNNGSTWSNPPIRVNDDATARSQFLPRIATNLLSGNIGVCWHDARNSAGNTAMQEFCTVSTPTPASPAFFANAQISDGSSTGSGSNPPAAGQLDIQFGDYSGLAYFQGLEHPIWADVSNSTGDNPDGTTRWDAYTDSVTGGAAANEGDPHITTVDNINYDFQSAGEFGALRDGEGLLVQTRQTPVATAAAIFNDYTGLTSCVSLNTAVAARVGTHRVTLQPNASGVPDPTGLQLRVDGALTTLSATGVSLGAGGRIIPAGSGGIEIDFPDGTVLLVTPNWWSTESKWFLNVDAFHTPALEGIMGARARGSWLPGLPDGTSLGPQPASLHQRYIDLNQKFADAWRVTDKTSLFDYAPGTSTATFTQASWPPENPPCVLPESHPAKPLSELVAQKLCRPIVGKNRHSNCVFDVMVTGNPGFAKAYLISQRLQAGSTTTTASADRGPGKPGASATLTAIVAPNARQGRVSPSGLVEFLIDGEKAGEPAKLDARGRATLQTGRIKPGRHQLVARYLPGKESRFLSSTSLETPVVVGGGTY
ncbi:MAG: Ig-like domain repeat protein [Acidobacteriota bacterium]